MNGNTVRRMPVRHVPSLYAIPRSEYDYVATVPSLSPYSTRITAVYTTSRAIYSSSNRPGLTLLHLLFSPSNSFWEQLGVLSDRS